MDGCPDEGTDETGEEFEDDTREETGLEPVLEGWPDEGTDETGVEVEDDTLEEGALEPVLEGEFEGEPDDG